MLVASRIIPLRLIQCCRPLEQTANGQDDDAGAPDVGKNHDLADSSDPVTTTNHLTQQPHVMSVPGVFTGLQLCAIVLPLRPAIFARHLLALLIAGLAQTLPA